MSKMSEMDQYIKDNGGLVVDDVKRLLKQAHDAHVLIATGLRYQSYNEQYLKDNGCDLIKQGLNRLEELLVENGADIPSH